MTVSAEHFADLRRLTTVDRTLVHRRAISEVFVTDCKALDRNTYLVAAHLPRGHSYYNDLPTPEHDLMLLVEAARQAAIYICHTYFEVPPDSAFIFRSAGITITHPENLQIASHTTEDLVLHAEISTVDRPKPIGAKLRFDVFVHGKPAGRFEGSLSFMPVADYLAFRQAVRAGLETGAAANPPVSDDEVRLQAPGDVGRGLSANVVIGTKRTGETVLVNRPEHPSMCDHEVDHVSGMVMMEAVRQAAIAYTGRTVANPVEYSLKFTNFVESDREANVYVVNAPRGYTVSIVQDGTVAASATVVFA